MSPQEKLKLWRNDPVQFVRDNFHVEPDPWQARVLSLFPFKQRISMQASKGVGKTTGLSWLVLNFISTRPYAKIAVTSISGDNLTDGLWSEIGKWYRESPFLQKAFVLTKTRLFAREAPETWFCSARTWSKSADATRQADTLAGLHADYILFVIDEVGGVPDAVMATAEAALASGIETKLVIAGNPTHNEGPLYRAATTEAHLWDLIKISSNPDDPNRSTRVSVQWAREQIEKYGVDADWVRVNVFGEFPKNSLNTLLGPDEVRAAINRHVPEESFTYAQKRLGVDVARFGDDKTVIFPRQGLMSFMPVELRNARSNEIAARLLDAKNKWNSEVELVDGTGGYGSGVVDSLIQAGHNPHEIHFSGKAIDNRYHNKRAEMWFSMAEWIKRGGSLPNVTELVKELTTVQYGITPQGRFIIEEKDQVKDRLGHSPDYADALALTFAIPEAPGMHMLHPLQRPSYKTEYDPWART